MPVFRRIDSELGKLLTFNSLYGDPAGPFRLAKLTACRKVRGMYRRYRSKSSRYGHESAMAQAHLCHLPALNHPGSMPLARIIRTTSGVAMKAIKARAVLLCPMPGAMPAA